MANANLKPRPRVKEHDIRIPVVLRDSPEPSHAAASDAKRPFFPWMQITDALLERLGFLPGQHVMFSVDHNYGQITISLDRDYTIAGKQMTQQQIRQRGTD